MQCTATQAIASSKGLRSSLERLLQADLCEETLEAAQSTVHNLELLEEIIAINLLDKAVVIEEKQSYAKQAVYDLT